MAKWLLMRGGTCLTVLESDGRQVFRDQFCEEGTYTETSAFVSVASLFA